VRTESQIPHDGETKVGDYDLGVPLLDFREDWAPQSSYYQFALSVSQIGERFRGTLCAPTTVVA
jgi:hypothetical protein